MRVLPASPAVLNGSAGRITHILETHRNEGLLSGAPALARLTGAPVHHGPHPEAAVVYAQIAREGDRFELGKLAFDRSKRRALHGGA